MASDNNFYSDDDDLFFEIFCLVWFDDRTNAKEARDAEEKLRSIVNNLKRFQGAEQCQRYIEERSKYKQIVMIVSGRLGLEIVPSIHHLRQIISIYVYCLNKESHEKWACKFAKVKAVVIKLDELISRIKDDHKIQKVIKEPLSINLFTTVSVASKSTTGINGNTIELNNLREFETIYSPDKVSWCENIHIIFLLRAFISDIQHQLKNLQTQKSLKVYRSQMISNDELKTLKESRSQFISVNSFFSTSISYQQALSFLNVLDDIDNLELVLFEIDVDPNMATTKPFADISSHSESNDESEMLFMVGSIFRLNSVSRSSDDPVWIIRMTLCNENEHDLKQVLMYMKQQLGDGETNLRTLGKLL
ncbi:unnamed protein product [Rotaria sp. Silwood1]|nr:unnamed protein product [Rotaria sp. Silwood1]